MESSHWWARPRDKVNTKGLIRNHWLIFGTEIFTFKYLASFNYYFGVKVLMSLPLDLHMNISDGPWSRPGRGASDHKKDLEFVKAAASQKAMPWNFAHDYSRKCLEVGKAAVRQEDNALESYTRVSQEGRQDSGEPRWQCIGLCT
jgi:hypothetical protein